MEKIVKTIQKVDFHIHSYASRHKEAKGIVDDSIVDNISVLINKLNENNVTMCSFSDHDNFDFEIYKRLKEEENKGSIKKVLPAVEFTIKFDAIPLHVITIFDDKDEN